MARITVPEGPGGELVQVWSLSPELGAAVGNLSAAVYGDRLIEPRVREVARMRIAQINGCNVCTNFRGGGNVSNRSTPEGLQKPTGSSLYNSAVRSLTSAAAHG